MLSQNLAEIIAMALEAKTFDVAKTIICRECHFIWEHRPDIDELKKHKDQRIRSICKYIGKPWVSVRSPSRILQGPEKLYEEVYGMSAAAIFTEPRIILHEDLTEYAGTLLPAMNGSVFWVAGRDCAGNITIERVRGRMIRSQGQTLYRSICEIVDVIPDGWRVDLRELRQSLGRYVEAYLSEHCRKCSVHKLPDIDLEVAAGFSRSF